MTLRFYNTLSRDTEIFTPIDPQNVRLYVCGPTVYDFAHIGNARPVIVFDVLFRLLRHVYGAEHVTYVRNITDVDDKINARAAEERVAIRDLTERTAEQFFKDAADLGTLSPTVQPRATEHIPEMIALIERLIAGGHAYAAEGHVLFGVPSMAEYGRLSRRGADDIRAGARVEVAPYKRDEQDFVLWKPSKSGEPAWESPWGAGRPGWHLECSAMAWKHLGEVFDLHGGGIDLVFPHHENEIAQSRCAFDTSLMAKVWMHNGFLQVEGEKMAKSLGNFITIRDLLNDWPGDVLRLAMLSSHYRQPINWTVKGLETATRTLEGWFDDASDKDGQPVPAVLDALMDDLNTPQAIAEIHAVRGDGPALAATLDFFGFRRESVEERRRSRRAALAGEVERLIAARTEARKSKNFAEADRIRDEISALGVTVKDSPQGTTWEVS